MDSCPGAAFEHQAAQQKAADPLTRGSQMEATQVVANRCGVVFWWEQAMSGVPMF